jgi:hypothetical protein
VHHATGHAAVNAIGVELDVDRLATVVSGQQQRLAGIEQVRAAPAPASDFSVRCKPRCAVRGSYPVNCATLPVHCRTGYSDGCNSGSSAVVGPGWPPPVLRGRHALRININSVLTRTEHIDELPDLLQREGAAALAERSLTR